MLEVNIPIWLLLTAAGLPLLLAAGVLYKERRKKGQKAGNPCISLDERIVRPEAFGIQIHQQLLEQHVDGAFSTVLAVLEAERCKLKALLKHSYSGAPADFMSPDAQSCSILPPFEEDPASDMPIAQRISVLMTQGIPAEKVAHHLGISQTEVTLALKMNGRRSTMGALNG
jgi:hypothetical protein